MPMVRFDRPLYLKEENPWNNGPDLGAETLKH